MLPRYLKPPVSEVVCGVLFERLASFKAPHSGLFWSQFKDSFPVCEHANRLGPFVAEDFPLMLPRVWLVSEDKRHIIQLQDDRFLFNWRRVEASDTYPGFETIYELFSSRYLQFKKFVEGEGLGSIKVKECELTYVNQIEESGQASSIERVNQAFPDLAWDGEARFLPPPIGVSWQGVFRLPQGKGTLTSKLQTANRKADDQPILVFELAARGLGTDPSSGRVDAWFQTAHGWIVQAFADLISDTYQEEKWQRVSVKSEGTDG